MSDMTNYDPILVLSAILRRNASQIQTHHGFVCLVNRNGKEAVVEYGMGLGENYVGCQVHPDEGVTGYILRSGYPQVIPHYQEWNGRFRGILAKNVPMVGTVAGTPVYVDNKIVAVLVFIFEAQELHTDMDLCAWLYQVGENAGNALNALDKHAPSDTNSEMMPPPIPA